MAVIPIVRCRQLSRSLPFYTTTLDFTLASGHADDLVDDPGVAILTRGGDSLILSSHTGDGEFGQAVVVTTDDVEGLVEGYRQRGLVVPVRPESPVHSGPIDQTWGTREFYLDDPDGNTLRFVQRTDEVAGG
jgi:catechol 2,3-dioxygenase-like lactoylglutathione lyase family enzyme